MAPRALILLVFLAPLVSCANLAAEILTAGERKEISDMLDSLTQDHDYVLSPTGELYPVGVEVDRSRGSVESPELGRIRNEPDTQAADRFTVHRRRIDPKTGRPTYACDVLRQAAIQ